MPIKILMPALSPTMKEGKLIRWIKNEGDEISSGDVIAEVETDKATMEVEAVDEGKLVKILVQGGTPNVAVNTAIGIILEEGETEEVLDQEQESDTDKKVDIENNSKPAEEEIKPHEVYSKKDRVIATPLAKKIAADKKIDISTVHGTGPRGRVVKDDVLKVVSSSVSDGSVQSPAQQDSIEISPMRRVIADRLVESKRNIPHFYLKTDCIIDKLLELRVQFNEKLEEKITINDFIVKASAIAISKVPELKMSWDGDRMIKNNSVDISVAVAIPDGLITPIVKNADLKSISEISSEVKLLVEKAKSNSLKPGEFQGGCFTISNLGMYGITEFSAIINPPQSAILAVGAARKLPVVIDEEIKIKTVMKLTLSCDHRVVDGAIGAKFLKQLKNLIEEPLLMLF